MNKDILVFIEQNGGKFQKVSLELLGEARKLSGNGKVLALVCGSGVLDSAKELIPFGADLVITADSLKLKDYLTENYTKALTGAIEEYKPEIVLIGGTDIGRDLAPRTAARLKTGLTADCTELKLDEAGDLLMTKPAFGENFAVITCKKNRPIMATIRPGVMAAPLADTARKGEVKALDGDFSGFDKVTLLEVLDSGEETGSITEAEVIVAGGRGAVGKFDLLKELASSLKGKVAASRAAVLDKAAEEVVMVGQTGKTVSPKAYIACGISGALQHTAGMEKSGFVIAIDKNDASAMLKAADLGVVGDIKVILPKLTEAIKKYELEKSV